SPLVRRPQGRLGNILFSAYSVPRRTFRAHCIPRDGVHPRAASRVRETDAAVLPPPLGCPVSLWHGKRSSPSDPHIVPPEGLLDVDARFTAIRKSSTTRRCSERNSAARQI